MEKHWAPSAQSYADGLPPRGVQVCCVFWRALTVEIVLELRVISDWLFVSLGLLHSACSGSSSRWTRRRPRPSEVHRQTHTHSACSDRTAEASVMPSQTICWRCTGMQKIGFRISCQDFYLYLPSDHTFDDGLPWWIISKWFGMFVQVGMKWKFQKSFSSYCEACLSEKWLLEQGKL